MQSTALPYTALPDPAPAMPYTAMLSTALPYSAMPQPQSPISSSGPPIKVKDDVEIISVWSASFRRPRPGDQATVKAPKRARSTSTSRRSISPSRDYPRGTSTATRPSQARPKRAEDRPAPAQDLEAFKAEMTSILSDMLHSFLSNLASQFKPSSRARETLCLHRMWLQINEI